MSQESDKKSEKNELKSKNEKKEKKVSLTPTSPAKRRRESKLEGKQTVSQILHHGITKGGASGISGQVYVVDYARSKILSLTSMDASMTVSVVVAKELTSV